MASRGQGGTAAEPPSMELLAPAGSMAAFEAALAEGADAVYVGAPAFNARALARDFSHAEIGAMIRQAHEQGRKLYIAMNSLIREDEMRRAVEALSIFARLGPDALIIQDLGLLHLARRYFPELVLHASTLMSVHNSVAARRLTGMGFERVVLARELTMEEIGKVAGQAGAELEIFVHGAMCFSYSGLCLFSSLHGGRSSLRGQCVQPCRRRYSWQSGHGGRGGRGSGRSRGKGGYLFSMNDLCGIDLLPAMQRLGIASLKIEGRLRSVEYVRKTVRAYRLALDRLGADSDSRQQVLAEAHRLLDEAMGRRRTPGFFLDSRPARVVTPAVSGNTGLLLGRVERLERRRGKAVLHLRLRGDVAVGDRLRLHDEASGERRAFTVYTLLVGGKTVKGARAGQAAAIVMPGDAAFARGFHGLLFRVDVGSRKGREQGRRVRPGRMARDRVTPDRGRVETVLDALQWRPVGSGRSAAGSSRSRSRGSRQQRQRGQAGTWWVRLRSLQAVRRRLPVRPARFLLPLNRETMAEIGKANRRGPSTPVPLVWCLPPVIQEADLDWYAAQVRMLLENGFSEFELGHCSQVALFSATMSRPAGQGGLRLHGGYTFNMLNSAALAAAARLGLAGVQFALETDESNLTSALATFRAVLRRRQRRDDGTAMKIGLLAYGRPPLFTARLQAEHFRYRQEFASPRGERFVLDQDHGLTHARSILPFSLLRFRNELFRAGVDYLVLDLGGGPLKREVETLSALLRGTGRLPPAMEGNYTGALV